MHVYLKSGCKSAKVLVYNISILNRLMKIIIYYTFIDRNITTRHQLTQVKKKIRTQKYTCMPNYY